jgi:integrase
LRRLAAWLGHTDARFTLSVYAHSNDNALAAAAAVLGNAVSTRDSAQSN